MQKKEKTKQRQIKKILTSELSPLRIDFLPKLWKGELGLSIAPGKKQKGGYHCDWDRDLMMDVKRIKQFYKIDVVVCFLERWEMKQFQISEELEELNKVGIITEHFPIVDMTVPKNQEQYKGLVNKVIDLYLNNGKKVLAHCRGGLGRAGTFATACVIRHGIPSNKALQIVRKARQNAVNEECQQKWLLDELKF